MTYMERAARLYRRENRKQLDLWFPAMVKACNGELDKSYKVNNCRKIWAWGINRWGIDFPLMEYKLREEDSQCS